MEEESPGFPVCEGPLQLSFLVFTQEVSGPTTDQAEPRRAASATVNRSSDSGTSKSESPKQYYLFNSKLSDGRSALLLDIGSVGNLMSYGWARIQAILALGQGFQSKEQKRETPLKISGVGHGHQICEKD